MKNTNIAIAIAFVASVIGFAGTASAQRTASASATASAKIVSGISLSKVQDLNFGQVVRSTAAGTVVLDPTSASRTFNGGVTVGQNGGNAYAQFTASGEASYAYSLTMPSSVTLTQTVTSGTPATMTVTSLASTLGSSNNGSLNNEGTNTFNVGGTLNVGASQATGNYTGTFNVTVSYQ